VAQTITALSIQDERIAEEFRLIEAGRISKGTIVEIDGDVPVGMKMKLGDFAEAISTRVWESVGRVSWQPFKEARGHVHGLKLSTVSQWQDYSRSGARPADIPSNPNVIYEDAGWVSWGDWLGTFRVADRQLAFRPFEKAREHARNLELKTGAQWIAFTRSGHC
jgi:hypothetical protein